MHLYVHMYIYIYIHLCVCVGMGIYVYIHMCVCVGTWGLLQTRCLIANDEIVGAYHMREPLEGHLQQQVGCKQAIILLRALGLRRDSRNSSSSDDQTQDLGYLGFLPGTYSQLTYNISRI